MLNSLIKKYGQVIQQNQTPVYAILNKNETIPFKTGFFHKALLDNYTGSKRIEILIREDLDEKDIFDVEGKQYRVWNHQKIKDGNNTIYNKAVIYEDDFTHNVNFYKQEILKTGCNLPSQAKLSYLTALAKIETVNENNYLQLGMYADDTTTHIFSLLYNEEIINRMDQIAWDDRRFQINSWINIDEKNRILKINTIETTGLLNA